MVKAAKAYTIVGQGLFSMIFRPCVGYNVYIMQPETRNKSFPQKFDLGISQNNVIKSTLVVLVRAFLCTHAASQKMSIFSNEWCVDKFDKHTLISQPTSSLVLHSHPTGLNHPSCTALSIVRIFQVFAPDFIRSSYKPDARACGFFFHPSRPIRLIDCISHFE